MTTEIVLDRVSFSYELPKKRTTLIFDDVTHRFSGGTSAAIMGPSGSGKTTLFRLLSQELTPSNGTISVDGRSLTEIPDLELRRFTVARIYQEYRLIPFLTCLENVQLPQEIAGTLRGNPNRAIELLDRVGLSKLKDSTVDTLSGGEQQRVAIARALVNRPAVLLADEPTGALDETNTRVVTKLLRDVAHNLDIAVIVATHDQLVAAAADQVFKIAEHTLTEEAA